VSVVSKYFGFQLNIRLALPLFGMLIAKAGTRQIFGIQRGFTIHGRTSKIASIEVIHVV
jgi:hypothetical protein